MTRGKLSLVAALVVALAGALGACGGGESDEDQITEVIETAVVSSDPADCTGLLSQRFVEQTTFEQGSAAIESCEKDAPDTSDNPKSVEVSNVQVEGETATAAVALTGGTFGGQTLELRLTRKGEDWKIDEIADISDFDLDAFAQSFEEELSSGEDPLTPKQAGCVGDQLAQGDPEKVKEVVLGGEAAPLVALIELCITS